MSNSPSSTNDEITTLLDNVMQQVREYEAEQERQQQEKSKQYDQRILQALEKKLTPLLAEEFRELFVITYEKTDTAYMAVIRYLDIAWTIQWMGDTSWNIGGDPIRGFRALGVLDNHLQEQLLLLFAKYRAYYQELETRIEKQRERERERVRQKVEEQEQQRLMKEERRTLLLAEQAAIQADIEKRLTEAQQALWHWPQDESVAIYQVRYTTSYAYNDDKETTFDYVQGWTAHERLTEDGWIRLMPYMYYSYPPRPETARDIKLIPQYHLPIWERFTYSSVEELPETLKREVTLTLEDVIEGYDELTRDYYLMHPVAGAYDGMRYHSIVVGYEPLQWVKDLL